MEIGILGGSFNPLHNGHLAVAAAALQRCALDEVWMMVSPENPLKQGMISTPAAERLAMTRRGVESFLKEHSALKGRLKVSDFEFSLPRPTYTVTTLRALAGEYPGVRFRWIVGGDNLRSLGKWLEPEEILRDYGLIVYPRGIDPLPDPLPEGVTLLGGEGLMDVSSTEIRRRMAAGDVENLPVPEGVLSWIAGGDATIRR